MNFHPQAPVPPTRLLNQHAKDAAKLRILLWRAIILLVYFSIHCLGMFVLAVFGFRAFQTSASSMNLIKNTSEISHWFLFLVATNPERIQPSGSSPTHTHSNSPETFSSLKATGRGDPQFHSFANTFRTEFWCLLFLRCLFTWKRASLLLPHNPTAVSNHHNSKTSCSCDTSAHKNKASEEP